MKGWSRRRGITKPIPWKAAYGAETSKLQFITRSVMTTMSKLQTSLKGSHNPRAGPLTVHPRA